MTNDDVIRARLEGIDVSYTRTLEQAEKSTVKFEKAGIKLQNSLKWMERAAKLYMFDQIVSYSRKIIHEFNQMLPKMDQVIKRAKQLDIAPKFLVAMHHGAKEAKVSSTIIERALIAINTQISRAASGSVTAQDKIRALGIGFKNLLPQDSEGRLKAVAEALKNLPYERRLAALSGLLGGSGAGSSGQSAMRATQLVTMFSKGAHGIEDMVQESEKFGISWTKAQTEAIEGASKAKMMMGTAFEGLTEQMTAGLAPAMKEIYEMFTDWVLKANQYGQIEEITQGIADAFRTAAKWSKEVAGYLERILRGGSDSQTTISAIEESKKNSGKDTYTVDGTEMYRTYGSEVGKLRRRFNKASGFEKYMATASSYMPGGVGDENSGGPQFNQAILAQRDAEKLLREKFHINTKDEKYGAGTSWISLAEDMVAERNRQNEELREKRIGKDAIDKEKAGVPLAQDQTRPDVFHDQGALLGAKELRKKQEDYEKTEIAILEQRADRQEKFAKDIEKQEEKLARAQEDVNKIKERQVEMGERRDEHLAGRDIDFKAVEAGSVEAYRAIASTGKADTTQLQQLREQQKIKEEEQKANTKLEEIKSELIKIQLPNFATFSLF